MTLDLTTWRPCRPQQGSRQEARTTLPETYCAVEEMHRMTRGELEGALGLEFHIKMMGDGQLSIHSKRSLYIYSFCKCCISVMYYLIQPTHRTFEEYVYYEF